MTEVMTPSLADFKARCFVNGVHRHSKSGKVEPIGGQFAERFLSHPWVRDSVKEGWGRELRMHLIQACKIKLMRNEPIGDIEGLMPDQKWISDAKRQAEIFRKAAEWRDQTYGKVNGDDILRRLGITLGDNAT